MHLTDFLPPLNVALLWATSLIALAFLLFRGYRFRQRRHKRMQRTARRVAEKIKKLPTFPHKLAYLRKINPFVFEEMLLDAFEMGGHKVERNKRYTGDGGIDGKVWINGSLYLIQAKRYKGHIAIAHLKEFNEILESSNCKGFFCHTGKTRTSGKEFATGTHLKIISGQKLVNMIEYGFQISKKK